MKCPKCGAETPEGSNFCQECGAKISQIDERPHTEKLHKYEEGELRKLVEKLNNLSKDSTKLNFPDSKGHIGKRSTRFNQKKIKSVKSIKKRIAEEEDKENENKGHKHKKNLLIGLLLIFVPYALAWILPPPPNDFIAVLFLAVIIYGIIKVIYAIIKMIIS